MERRSDEISMQEAMRLAKSDAGQRLFQLLKAQNSDAMDRAMSDAAAGDYTKVKESLMTMLGSPEVRRLMEQLKGDPNG